MNRRFLIQVGLIAILVAAFALPLQAETPPVILNHQGRLLDASDQPVTGTVSLTFRIYEAPTGGAPLWSEAHPSVSVNAGLFTEELGALTPLPVDVISPTGEVGATRWLEIEVNGDVLVPRTRLGTTPSAASSSRVSGDISTAPGAVTMSGLSGSTTGTIRMAASGDSSVTTIDSDSDGDGVPESSVSHKTSGPRAGSILSGMSGSTTGTIRMAASSDSTGTTLDSDDDGDGVPESSVSYKTSGPKSTGTLSGMSGSTTGTIRMTAASDSTGTILDSDSDGDGVPESSVSSKTSGPRAGSILSGMSGSTTGTIRMAASPDSNTTALDSDADGDGVPESSVKSKTSGPRAGSILSGMSGSTTGTIRMSAAPDSTTTILGTDTDGDGLPNNLLVHKSKGTKAGSTLSGMSGSTTATIRMQAAGGDVQGPASSSVFLDMDDDADGVPEGGCSLEALVPRSVLKTYFESGDVPTQDNVVQTSCDADGAEVALHRPPTALLTWGTGLAVRVDGTGPSMTIDVDSVPTFTVRSNSDSTVLTLKAAGSGDTPKAQMFADLIDSYIHLEDDGVTTYSASASTGMQLRDASNTVTCAIDRDGGGYLSGKLGIGVLTPTEKIEVAGGAYCDGTNWVNASDVNSKENFRAIDGVELLSQLADLEITAWNYKGDKDVTHMGPTAQDFRKSFGLGKDDKSISTIDPSGVALAAIKALYELSQQQAEEIKSLKREVAGLRGGHR